MQRKILHHILFWSGYLLFEAYLEFAWISTSFAHIHPLRRFLMALLEESTLLVVRIPMVYILFYVIAKFTISEKKYVKAFILVAFVLIIATILCRILITQFLLPDVYMISEPEPVFAFQRIISSFLDLIFIFGVTTGIKQYRWQMSLREQQKDLTKEKIEAELNLLKAQINPHFLFNTLNNIYGLALKNSEHTAPVVMKLSKLLRFMLYESEKDRILIHEELKVIEHYIELEKIRYNKRLTLSFIKRIDNMDSKIVPLLLLPFIENAFKHGASESRENIFIDIELQVNQHDLWFKISNSKEETGTVKVIENIGLKNIKRQLELTYREFNLEIKNEVNVFYVTLNINLDSYVAI